MMRVSVSVSVSVAVAVAAVPDRHVHHRLVGAAFVATVRSLRVAVTGNRLAGPRLGATRAPARAGRSGRWGRGRRAHGAELAAGGAPAVAATAAAAAATRIAIAATATATDIDGRRGELARRSADRRGATGATGSALGRRRCGAQLHVAAAGRDARRGGPDVERHHADQGDEDDRGTGQHAAGSADADDE